MSAVPELRLHLQPLRERDLEAVNAIECDLYEFPWTAGNFRDSLAAGYSCWGLWRGRELVGYAVLMIGPGEAHLLNLSVAAPHQRQGCARLLLRHLIELAQECRATSLLLEVRPSNTAARALYAQFGFVQAGLRRAYYPARAGREDALLLSIAL